jgi:hypothetical protein
MGTEIIRSAGPNPAKGTKAYAVFFACFLRRFYLPMKTTEKISELFFYVNKLAINPPPIRRGTIGNLFLTFYFSLYTT